MPTTFFIRHTPDLAVSDTDVKGLEAADRIAIHYPGEGAEDLRSLDPLDYTGSERRAINALVELSRQGGYVWAEYRTTTVATVGFVRPATPVEFVETTWSAYYTGRTAILKTLPLERTRRVQPFELLCLRATRPRQGTICRWWRASDGVQAAVDRVAREFELCHLSPDQLETACAEFLRDTGRGSLPTLRWLLMPVGRTLKDIDIYGMATDGKEIFAQVTFSSLDAAAYKLASLGPYRTPRTHVLLFCETPDIGVAEGVHIVPVRMVEEWIHQRTELQEALVPCL